MTIADLKKKAESGAYVDNNARELDTFKAKYSKPKTPAQAKLSNPAQINPNVLSGMDVLNAQTGKVNAPLEVDAAAGASLKKAGLTDAYNEWLDKQYANNSTVLMDYLNARYDQDRLESRWLGVPVTLPEHSGKGAGAEEVEKAAKKAKMALKLTDEQLNDIFERTKLTGLQEANYYAGRTLSGAASSVAGAAQLAAALPYYGLSVAGGIVDRTVEAAGGNTQFENFFGDTAKNIMTGDPLGANRFANYVNGLVKGKYLSQTQQTISNLAENAGAMIPAIATGNIAGTLGATATGAEAANFAVFGSGAAGNATQRAMQEGADIGTALSYGVMSGMVEVITEKMFAGIAGMNKSGVIDDLVKGLERNGTMRMLVDTLGEGVEEIVAEVIDPFLKRATYDQNATNADLKDLLDAAKSGVLLSLIMNGAGIAMRGGDISALMGSNKGMTEAETLRNDKYGRLGKTDTGMVDDTLNNYNQRIDDILNADRNEAIKGLIRSGLSGQEGGEAYNLAWDMRQRYAEGEDLTGGELRQLYKANDNEIRQENDAEVERLAKGLAPSLSAALIDNYDNTTSPARYYLEMKNAYNAAQKGEAYKSDFLNANQISAAMQAAQGTQNNIASTKNTGYNLLNDDYIRQMIEKGEIPNVGKQSSSTNAGRENNLASVEQGGSMEARAGEAQGRRPGSFEAQRAAKIAANAEVQRAGKVSGQGIHLRGASSEKSFKVIPRSVWSQDESLDKIAQNYKKRGINVVFIYGNIGLEGGGYARGAHRGNVMYINIADGEATAEQIAAHEYFHDFLDRYAQTGAKAFKKSADEARSWAVQQLVKKIRSTYGDGIDELMSVYAETYFTDEDGNITVDADYILEEILCDAAADIDILAGRKAETQRASLYGETVREELNRMDEAVTRADTDDGGETKYNRGKENNGNDRTETGKRTPIRHTGNAELQGTRPGNEGQNRRRTVSNGARHTDMGGRTEGERQTTRNAKAGRAWSTFKAAERNKVINIIKKYDSRSYEATRAKALIGMNKYAERVYNAFLEGEVPFENKYNYDFTDLEKVKDELYDFIAENPKIRWSRVIYDEQAKKEHAEKAIQHFGKTYNWNETGYITQDGTRIDFSGKHDGAPGGYRTVDHRDISDALGLDYGGEDYSGAMLQFMSEGNIRISPESGGINVMIEPTKEQYERLKDFISRNRGEVVLDVDDENGIPAYSAEWPKGTHSNKVIDDIKDYFQNGAKPKRSLIAEFHSQFSRITPQQDADYLAAVERGDMETAQKMVDEAAEAAGYTVKAYHGTPDSFTVFNLAKTSPYNRMGRGFYFSDSESEAENYSGKSETRTSDLLNRIEQETNNRYDEQYGSSDFDYAESVEKWNEIYDQISGEFAKNGHVISAYLSMKNPAYYRKATNGIYAYSFYDRAGNDLGIGYLDTIDGAAELEKRGYDGIVDETVGEMFDSKANAHYTVFSSEQAKSADPVTYDDNGNVIPLSERFNPENDDIRYSRVTDKDTLKKLNEQDTLKVYRAMQVIDGKLYPPMAAKIADENGKTSLVEPLEIDEWYQADERPDLIRKGKFRLNKGTGTAIDAAYNPYFHTSASPLNDQFTSAYKRPNLVVVEGEIPKSELTSGYKAEGAKDSVGATKWHSGVVASKLKGDKARVVYLSRWFKATRIVPDSEVAKIVADTLKGEDITIPENVVTPSLLSELQKRGVKTGGIAGLTRKRTDAENSDTSYSRATPEESTIAQLEAENARLRERAEYWQKQTKLTQPKILNHKGVGKIASDLLTEYDSVSDKNELHAALFKLGNEILRGREEGHALTWERVTERAEALARDILNNSRVLVNTDEYREYNELKKYLRNNKIHYQNDGNIPDFPAWRKQHKGLNLRQNEGIPADIAYNELRERFGNALFPEDIINPADQVIRMGEVLNGFEPVFENPYSYDMALAVEETADDIIDRLLNAAEDKSFADKQEERYQALKADSAAKLSEAKAKQAEAIKALKADNAARLREVRNQRDDKIKTLKEYYAAAKRDRAEAKADSEARSRLLRIVKRLKNRKLPAATRAMLDGYIADIDTAAKSITGKSIEKLSELRDWYTEQIENNPNFVRDEGIEKALQRLSNRKIGDMSAEEVADLTNILLGIEHEIREHNKFIESEYKKNIYEAGAQTVMDLQDVKGASLPKLNKLETEMLSPIRAIHRFVGYKDDSPMMIFANELNEGQHKMLDYQRKAYEAFNQFLEDKDFMKSLTGKHATKIKVQGVTPTGEAGEAYISPAMKIALAAHAMNPQNMKHIVDGGVTIPDFDLYNKGKQAEAYSRNTRLRFTKSQLEGIAATLTPKERAFLNAVMTYFNVTSRNAINETSEALKGYSLADVENYFPINSDDAFLKNDFESLKFDGTIEGMGFLKDRIRGAANPIYLRDVVTVLNKAIEQHSRYYGLAVPLRNFNKLWNVNTRGATQDLQFDEENRPYTEDGDVINGYISSVKDAMRRAWLDAGENYIEKLVKDLSGIHKQSETLDKLLNMVRGSYAKAVLTLNLGVAIKQAASYPTAAAVLGWRPLARAMANIGRVNMDTINKYTPLQHHRSIGYSTQEQGEFAERGKPLPKVLNWIQGMDIVTTRKLWKATEYYVRRANRDLTVGSPAYYNAVAAIYNRVIEETQPNYTTMQRPGLLRSENALLQSLMMFKTQPFQNYNILSDALGNLAAKRRAWKATGLPEAKAAYKEAKRTAVRAVTSQFVANAVFVGMAAAWALFRGKTKNYKDDDDEYTWKSVMSKIGRDMVGTAAGMVPFGSEFWELVQSLAFDETYYGIETVTASAISDALSAIKKAWNSTATIIDDVKNPDKEANWNKYVFQMESVANAISKLVGVPVENITNLLKAVTLRAADAICDDEYEAQYVALRISTDPITDSGAYIDNLYNAKKNGAKSYTELYNLMVNAGISEDKIKNGMEKRMKAAEGVEKVDDLDERYLAPKQETIYQKALRELEQSDTYKVATDEQKKGAKSDLYDLYAQTADGKKMREKIDEGKDYDVSDTDYIEFLLSLHEHDEPTENGNYGSYTNDEIIAALKAMDITNKERAYLYSTRNSSKSNNPWARYLPR